jgi:hypothetical protein
MAADQAQEPTAPGTVELLLDVVRTESGRCLDRLAGLDARTIAIVAVAGTLQTIATGVKALERSGLLASVSRIAAIAAFAAAVWAYTLALHPGAHHRSSRNGRDARRPRLGQASTGVRLPRPSG